MVGLRVTLRATLRIILRVTLRMTLRVTLLHPCCNINSRYSSFILDFETLRLPLKSTLRVTMRATLRVILCVTLRLTLGVTLRVTFRVTLRVWDSWLHWEYQHPFISLYSECDHMTKVTWSHSLYINDAIPSLALCYVGKFSTVLFSLSSKIDKLYIKRKVLVMNWLVAWRC